MNNDYFVHESSYVDEGCQIGKGTKIWHFSHIMSGCVIGENCNIGQNVVISPDVVLGRNCKIQNNVSVYTGVRCEDDVFLGPSRQYVERTPPVAPIPATRELASGCHDYGRRPGIALRRQLSGRGRRKAVFEYLCERTRRTGTLGQAIFNRRSYQYFRYGTFAIPASGYENAVFLLGQRRNYR